VGTIDRYGLKKYHLHKHKKDVDAFVRARRNTFPTSTNDFDGRVHLA
jgi:hypothetical protein